jgi:hypothetical protein
MMMMMIVLTLMTMVGTLVLGIAWWHIINNAPQQ